MRAALRRATIAMTLSLVGCGARVTTDCGGPNQCTCEFANTANADCVTPFAAVCPTGSKNPDPLRCEPGLRAGTTDRDAWCCE